MEQLSIFEGEYTPKFRAYLKYMGKNYANDVSLRNFMDWLEENLIKFKKENKIGNFDRLTDEQNELFTTYLLERKRNEGNKKARISPSA